MSTVKAAGPNTETKPEQGLETNTIDGFVLPLHMHATQEGVTKLIHRLGSPPASPPSHMFARKKVISQRNKHSRSRSLPNIYASSNNEENLDILTDRMGNADLRYSEMRKIVQDTLQHKGTTLPSLMERMSDESLEDSHAFSDFSKLTTGRKLRCLAELSSYSPANPPALEPLVESDDEGDVKESPGKVGAFAPPLHIHATRGVIEQIHPGNPHSDLPPSFFPRKSSSRGQNHARSNSLPNIYAGALTDVGNDILTDRMGIADLRYSEMQTIVQDALHQKRTSLQSVVERMSEESLEDCHAFSDVSNVTAGRNDGCLTESSSIPPALEALVESDQEEKPDLQKVSTKKKAKAHNRVFSIPSIRKTK
jgi:hypothetical protein